MKQDYDNGGPTNSSTGGRPCLIHKAGESLSDVGTWGREAGLELVANEPLGNHRPGQSPMRMICCDVGCASAEGSMHI